jgi:hypothetical protein
MSYATSPSPYLTISTHHFHSPSQHLTISPSHHLTISPFQHTLYSAGDHARILELRKFAHFSERRADKALTRAERWRLPLILLKRMRYKFLSIREEETLEPVLDRAEAKFKNQDILVAVKKALETPLLFPTSLKSPGWSPSKVGGLVAAGINTVKRSLGRMSSNSKLKAESVSASVSEGEGVIESAKLGQEVTEVTEGSNKVKPQLALRSSSKYRVRSPTHADMDMADMDMDMDMGTEQKEEEGPFDIADTAGLTLVSSLAGQDTQDAQDAVTLLTDAGRCLSIHSIHSIHSMPSIPSIDTQHEHAVAKTKPQVPSLPSLPSPPSLSTPKSQIPTPKSTKSPNFELFGLSPKSPTWKSPLSPITASSKTSKTPKNTKNTMNTMKPNPKSVKRKTSGLSAKSTRSSQSSVSLSAANFYNRQPSAVNAAEKSALRQRGEETSTRRRGVLSHTADSHSSRKRVGPTKAKGVGHAVSRILAAMGV